MVLAHKYAPIKCCIYCGAEKYHGSSDRKLGDEHIIPEGLGGRLILPEASCKKCEDVINRYEQPVIKGIYHVARKKMKVRSKKNRKPPPIPIQITRFGEESTLMIPVDDYPGLIVTFTFFPPTIFSISTPIAMEEFGAGIAAASLPTFGEQLNAVLGMTITEFFPGKISFPPIHPDATAKKLALMLAKIAHSYAVAELGIDSFHSYLREIIRGEAPQYLSHYVGGTYDEKPQPTQEMFEIFLEEKAGHTGEMHLVCSIRIYSHYSGMPRYLVVVGKKK